MKQSQMNKGEARENETEKRQKREKKTTLTVMRIVTTDVYRIGHWSFIQVSGINIDPLGLSRQYNWQSN